LILIFKVKILKI